MSVADWAVIAAVVVAVVLALLILRMAKFLSPGWRLEIRLLNGEVRVLDKPGFYMVSPFLSVKRVKVQGTSPPTGQRGP